MLSFNALCENMTNWIGVALVTGWLCSDEAGGPVVSRYSRYEAVDLSFDLPVGGAARSGRGSFQKAQPQGRYRCTYARYFSLLKYEY